MFSFEIPENAVELDYSEANRDARKAATRTRFMREIRNARNAAFRAGILTVALAVVSIFTPLVWIATGVAALAAAYLVFTTWALGTRQP
jgi:hypothetical protein